MKHTIFSILTLSLWLTLRTVQAQPNLTITGQVSNAASGVSLAGATITVLERVDTGARTDGDGRFALTLPAGKQTLLFSYLGFTPQRITLNLSRYEVVDILLNASDSQLNEVVVTSQRNQDKVMSTQTSADAVDRRTALVLPVAFGEVDLIKVLQLKPGVKSTGEGTSGISVRGGSTDQNLFQYDGTTVYNPSHLFGFVSTFNIDAVKGVSLYKAGFPAEYSGRLSSVVDVTSLAPKDSSTLTATTRFIRPVPIKSITPTFNQRDEAYGLTKFDDDPRQKNYYRLTLTRNVRVDTLSLDALIDDSFSNGEEINWGSGYTFRKGDTIHATLYHCTEAYYNFLTTSRSARQANVNPFAASGEVISNITGGLGVFATLSYSYQTAVVP